MIDLSEIPEFLRRLPKEANAMPQRPLDESKKYLRENHADRDAANGNLEDEPK